MRKNIKYQENTQGGITAWSTKGLDKQILVYRNAGGAGDILMHRVLFEGIKQKHDCNLTVAIPEKYFPLICDHPAVDRIIDCKNINNKNGYKRSFNTLGKAAIYEFAKMPFVDQHRTDLWASYLGIKINGYKARFRFTGRELNMADHFFVNFKRPFVGISPVSAHPSKDLKRSVIQELINMLNSKGASCFIFHSEPLEYEHAVDVNVGLREWLCLTRRLDAVVTVATSMFHVANLFHIPTVAIFGVEDLRIFGKYFPEMIPIQRTRKSPEWPYCPCWSSLDCKLRPKNEREIYPPPCLQSITSEEIYEKTKKIIEI